MADDAGALKEKPAPPQGKMEILRRHAFKPGQTANPTGANGRVRAALIRKYLDEPSNDLNRTRFERVLEATYIGALKGSHTDRRTLIEYHEGKVPFGLEEQRLAIANHLQAVAKAAADTILAALGSRKEKMEPADIAEFLAKVAVDTRAHLRAADAVLAEQAELTQPALPAVPDEEELPPMADKEPE